VLGALLFGVPALLVLVRRRRARAPAADGEDPARERVARAMAVGLVIWLAAGTVLFSGMARLHPRYVEGFTPAVAAVLGIGLGWATDSGRGARARATLLGVGLLLMTVYTARLLYGATAVWWVMALAAVAATAAALLAWRRPRAALSAIALLLALVAVLAVPVMASVNAIREKVSDAGHVGAINAGDLVRLSAFLRAHQGRARYEVASDSATKVGSLIVRDGRPVLILTTYNARTLTSVDSLRRLAAQGQVAYALVGGACGPHTPHTDASCSAPAIWVRAHALDVSRQAGLSRRGVLWQLPGAIA
jgi:hypothetical protein